jgi:O-antigen ligase
LPGKCAKLNGAQYILVTWWIWSISPLINYVAAFGLMSFRFIPSFQRKLHITCQSISSVLQGQAVENRSDFGRITSVEAGLNTGMSHLWTGAGVGDIKREVSNYYQAYYPEFGFDEILPHNQFVYVFAAAGLPGLIWFAAVVLYPVFLYFWVGNNLALIFLLRTVRSFVWLMRVDNQPYKPLSTSSTMHKT